MAEKLYVLCELTRQDGPDGTKGFRVVRVVTNENKAESWSEGQGRFYTEMEEIEPGLYEKVKGPIALPQR